MLSGSSCGIAVVAVLCGLTLTSCADSGVKTQDPADPGARPSPGTPAAPAAAVNPRVQAALDVYAAFNHASLVAERKPFGPNEAFDSAANYVQYSFDPLRYETNVYVWNLADQGIVFKGSPPSSNVRVQSADLTARPYPKVTVTDCQSTDGSWLPYYRDGGKPVPTVRPSGAKAKPPYQTTVTLIYYQKHWGAQKLALDTSRTCTP